MASSSEIERAMKAISSSSAAARAMEALSSSSAGVRAMEALSSSSIGAMAMQAMSVSAAGARAMEALSSSSTGAMAMQAMSVSAAGARAMEALSSSAAGAMAMQAMSVSAAGARAMEALSSSAAGARAMEAMSLSSASVKAIAAISTTSAIEKAISTFASPSVLDEVFTSMTVDISNLDSSVEFSIDDEKKIEEGLENANSEFSEVQDAKSFLDVLKKAPPLIQLILLFLILNVFLPNLNGITANLLTPKIESYLYESDAPKREKIRHIKKLPITLNNIDTTHLRFISGENVFLRRSPSVKAEILDLTVLGQIVTILSKKRNWIEVEYEYEDGEMMRGWVFTRYTSKFIK